MDRKLLRGDIKAGGFLVIFYPLSTSFCFWVINPHLSLLYSEVSPISLPYCNTLIAIALNKILLIILTGVRKFLTILKLASSRSFLNILHSCPSQMPFPDLWEPPLSAPYHKQAYDNDCAGFPATIPWSSLPVIGQLPAPLPAPPAASPQLHDQPFMQRTQL